MGSSSDSSSAQYIHMVQHLIEECIMFNMSKEECMETLSKHANIKPVITSTVWKELEKENKDFFEAYIKKREEKISSETETTSSQSQSQISQIQTIHSIVSESPRNKADTNYDESQII